MHAYHFFATYDWRLNSLIIIDFLKSPLINQIMRQKLFPDYKAKRLLRKTLCVRVFSTKLNKHENLK